MTFSDDASKPLSCPFSHLGMQDADEIDVPKKRHGNGVYWVGCDCGARGPREDDGNKAVKAWNARGE